jgi:hypothetical protein
LKQIHDAVLRHLIKFEISSLWTKSDGFSPSNIESHRLGYISTSGRETSSEKDRVQILVIQEILYPIVMSDEDFLCQQQM